MRPIVWVCVVVFAVVMEGVSFAAHRIVDNFGGVGALVTIAAIYGAARYCEWRR